MPGRGLCAAAQDRLPTPCQQSKGTFGAGCRVTATRPSGLFAAEALVVGNAPGIGHRGTSSGLPKRIHIPLQPPQIAQPRQTLLSPGAAGSCNRTNYLQTNCGLSNQEEKAQTTSCWGNLSQMDTQFKQIIDCQKLSELLCKLPSSQNNYSSPLLGRRRSAYSTVTDLARFLGWSTSQPRRTAM